MTRLKAVDATVQTREALLLFARNFAAEADRLEAENTRLRARIKAADDIPEALAEGGVDGIERCHKAIVKLRADAARLDWLLLHCTPFEPSRDRPLIETRNGIDGAMAVEADRSEETQ